MDIHIIDLIIFIGYLIFMLGIGFYFKKKTNLKMIIMWEAGIFQLVTLVYP